MDKQVNLIAQIDSLKEELDALRPFKKEDEIRLWEKFRLEWNYNSNHIEGNTLSYGETYLLLIKGEVVGDHKAQEIDEMRAHDLVVLKVKEYAEDKGRELTEADIREWNKIILVRPYWTEAQTLDGNRTRKLIEPGNYKKTPNSVLLANGEIFQYASPEETPMLMQELLEWYRNESAKKELHPVQLSALLHYKLVRIHPFDDSNGRTSRLLMNYELLRNGFPPVIIKSSDKKNYLFALSKADAGDLTSFIEYIAEQLIWSIKIAISAGNGKSVEETGDIYKEIELWKRTIKQKEINIYLPGDRIVELYKQSIRTLFIDFREKHKVFEEAFRKVSVKVLVGLPNTLNSIDHGPKWVKALDEWMLRPKISFSRKSKFYVKMSLKFSGLKSEKEPIRDIESLLEVSFSPDTYKIILNGTVYLERQYTSELHGSEISDLIEEALKSVFSKIDK